MGLIRPRPCASVVCNLVLTVIVAGELFLARPAGAETRQNLVLRGHQQSLYIYGSPQGDPVIVSSGDGGWIHLAPYVADFLGARGFFVVGFNTKSYLESFTSPHSTLRTDEAASDYGVLAAFAREQTGKTPILIGVSEGAGLSVLAATDARTKTAIAGVIALGLPDRNELGWRWKDAAIYLTHGVPDEPTFSAAAIVDHVAPLPFAAIASTHDEFVPVTEVDKILNAAAEPKHLWIVNASNHRFSNNLLEFDQRLLDALAWARKNSPAR
jgi:hypothetical protein